MALVRAFKRLLGLLIVAVAALLGLFALVGYFAENTSGSRTLPAVIGGLAILLLVIGLRWLTIEDYHGVLPRRVSPDEAQRIVEFLEDHYLPCPFCGIEICATDDQCCACGKSLRTMRIPIKL